MELTDTEIIRLEDTLEVLMRPTDAALALGVTPKRVRTMFDDGALSGIRTPLGRLITRESLHRALVRQGRKNHPALEDQSAR